MPASTEMEVAKITNSNEVHCRDSMLNVHNGQVSTIGVGSELKVGAVSFAHAKISGHAP